MKTLKPDFHIFVVGVFVIFVVADVCIHCGLRAVSNFKLYDKCSLSKTCVGCAFLLKLNWCLLLPLEKKEIPNILMHLTHVRHDPSHACARGWPLARAAGVVRTTMMTIARRAGNV